MAATVAACAVAGIAVKKFADTIESQTDKLAGFSLALSAAQARTEISREAALRRRAERLGPQLASAEVLRRRFEDKLFDLGTEILDILLRLLATFEPIIDVTISAMGLVAKFLEQNAEAIRVVLGLMFPILNVLEVIADLIRRFMGEQADDEDVNDPFAEEFMNLFRRNAGQNPGRPVAVPGV